MEEAKIELVKSDDPLQTGLDIFARPPGKTLKYYFVIWWEKH